MTVTLKRWHWMLFTTLSLIQLSGLWITISRSPYGPAVVDFFRHQNWPGAWIPVSYVFSSAFGTTVILAKLTEVFSKGADKGPR